MDADILTQAMSNIGCEIKLIEMPWVRTLRYVKSGEIDIAIGASYKDKRANWSYYSNSYKYINHWLYTQDNKHKNIDSLESFFKNKLNLGIVIGWGYPFEIRREIDIKENKDFIISYPRFEQLPKVLKKNRIDGIIANPKHLKAEIAKNSFINNFEPRAQYKEELYFMFSKQSINPKIVLDFNNALYKLIYSGQRKQIFSRYKEKN